MLGWHWGFWIPGLFGFATAVMVYWLVQDRPRTLGLPTVAEWRNDHYAGSSPQSQDRSVFATQMSILKIPVIWVLALSSATIYVTRYAINSWGVLYLQEARGYSLPMAGTLLMISTVAGIVGTARNCSRIASSNPSTADPAGLRRYFGGASEAIAARTVFLEIPNVLAIVLIGNRSARRSRRISAQSSTANNSLRSSRLETSRESGQRGSRFGRRSGVSFQPSLTTGPRVVPPPTSPSPPCEREDPWRYQSEASSMAGPEINATVRV